MKIEMRIKTMPEYIEREALKEDIKNHFKKLIDEGYVYDEIFESNAEISRIIDEHPTADVAEVKHGKWLMRGGWFRCSECDEKAELRDVGGTGGFSHEYEQIKSNYCPNCGAEMDKE